MAKVVLEHGYCTPQGSNTIFCQGTDARPRAEEGLDLPRRLARKKKTKLMCNDAIKMLPDKKAIASMVKCTN